MPSRLTKATKLQAMDEFRVIDQLKAELRFRSSLRSIRDLAHELGLDHSNLHKFIEGKRGIELETFARICEILDLELRPRQPPKGG